WNSIERQCHGRGIVLNFPRSRQCGLARDQRNPNRLCFRADLVVNLGQYSRRFGLARLVERAKRTDGQLHDTISCRSVTRFCPANTIPPLTQFSTSMTPAMGAATAIS